MDGVFIAVGITPDTGFVKDFVELDSQGYIIAGEDGKTSRPGCIRRRRCADEAAAPGDYGRCGRRQLHHLCGGIPAGKSRIIEELIYSRGQRAKRTCLYVHLATAARVKYSVACCGGI